MLMEIKHETSREHCGQGMSDPIRVEVGTHLHSRGDLWEEVTRLSSLREPFLIDFLSLREGVLRVEGVE